MSHLLALALSAALFTASALGAQSATTATEAAIPGVVDSVLLRAIDLPRVMQRARAAGVPDSIIRGTVDRMRQRGLPAGDASDVVTLEVESVERGGDRNNFGAFVRTQVESGLRGRDLAAAIRAERARRGMGPADRGGRPEAAGARPDGRGGRPEGRGGRPEVRGGRADSTARPDVRGNRPATGAQPPRPRGDSADKPPTRGRRP